MSAGRYDNLSIQQGVEFNLPLALEKPRGTPWNLTGAVFRAQFRYHYKDATPALTFDVQLQSATGGLINLHASASATLALDGGDLPQGFLAGVWNLDVLESPTSSGAWQGVLAGVGKVLAGAAR